MKQELQMLKKRSLNNVKNIMNQNHENVTNEHVTCLHLLVLVMTANECYWNDLNVYIRMCVPILCVYLTASVGGYAFCAFVRMFAI